MPKNEFIIASSELSDATFHHIGRGSQLMTSPPEPQYFHILIRLEDMPILTQALDALTQDAKALLADENPLVVDKGQAILRQIHRIKQSIEP